MKTLIINAQDQLTRNTLCQILFSTFCNGESAESNESNKKSQFSSPSDCESLWEGQREMVHAQLLYTCRHTRQRCSIDTLLHKVDLQTVVEVVDLLNNVLRKCYEIDWPARLHCRDHYCSGWSYKAAKLYLRVCQSFCPPPVSNT